MTSRQIRAEDLEHVVEIHRNAFPGFLMTLLGRAFLRRYYELVLAYRGGILIGSYQGDDLVGFVGGFVGPKDFYARLRAARLELLLLAFSHLVIRPGLWRRVLESTRLGGADGSIEEGSLQAELASVAVTPAAQGRGYGVRLLQRFIAAAGVAGAKEVVLTTDAFDNDAANQLYQNNGFKLFHVSTRGNGRTMNHYRLKI